MEYRTTTAMHVVNGDHVLINGQYRYVREAHYAGPIDATGTTTLVLSNSTWSGPATTTVRVGR